MWFRYTIHRSDGIYIYIYKYIHKYRKSKWNSNSTLIHPYQFGHSTARKRKARKNCRKQRQMLGLCERWAANYMARIGCPALGYIYIYKENVWTKALVHKDDEQLFEPHFILAWVDTFLSKLPSTSLQMTATKSSCLNNWDQVKVPKKLTASLHLNMGWLEDARFYLPGGESFPGRCKTRGSFQGVFWLPWNQQRFVSTWKWML